MITTLIHTFTIAMSSPYSADVSVHLERCISPTVEVRPVKPIVILACESGKIIVNCSQKNKTITSLLDNKGLYLGHIQCRKK